MNKCKAACKIAFNFVLLAVWIDLSFPVDTVGASAVPERHSIYKDDLPVQPKVRPAFTPLPIGQVRPTGWLLDWAKDAGNGLTGHLDERADTFKNAWKGFHFEAVGVEPNGTGWPLEQCSYWLDGSVRLAFILDDPCLIDKAASRLDMVVDGVLKGGDSFIYWLDKSILDNAFNSWAHSHMGRAFVAYYQATGNPRVLEALQRVYRDYPLADMTAQGFGAVNLDAMLDTYAMSGDEQVLNNALGITSRNPFQDVIDNWLKDELLIDHTVIYYENARLPVLLYPWTGDERMLRAAMHNLELSDRYHGLPMGVCSGEEFLAGIGSTRHIETCDVAAAQWTYNWLLRITGDGRYGDRVEKIFFNAAPPPVDQNFDEMSYFQAPNRVESLLPGERAFGGGYSYSSLGGGALCCPANMTRILPNYIMYMWMGTGDGGLAATLYGPCRVRTTAADHIPVSIDCRTNYPFEETIRLTIQPKTRATFPLYLRIPAWAKAPTLKVNDESISVQPGQDGFVKLERLWNPGDRIVLQLPMTVHVEQGHETPFPQIEYFQKESVYKRDSAQLTEVNNPYACVHYGPLLFALPLPDKTPDLQVENTPFNFALEGDDGKLASKIKVSRLTFPKRWKWRWDLAPIQLEVPARQFDWSPTGLQPLPREFVKGGSPTTIKLVPYGCTKFHICMFPVADSSSTTSKAGCDLDRILDNTLLSLTIDGKTGAMTRVENKLTGEVYIITGDAFSVKTIDWDIDFGDVKLTSLTRQPGRIIAHYEHEKLDIEVGYLLGADDHFAQKKMQMTFKEKCGLKEVVVSQPTFSADGLQMVCYRYPNFDIVRAMVKARHGWDFQRPPDSEPVRTFFGRTDRGGFFTGVEMPYDASELKNNRVTLCYSPGLKIKAGKILDGETVYLGVYHRSKQDANDDNSWQSIESLWSGNTESGSFDGAAAAGTDNKTVPAKEEIRVCKPDVLPLPSESAAMSAMVASVLGPPRHGVMAFACGWHCQMQQDGYDCEEELQTDMKGLELFQQCGLNGFTESQPWGGETEKLNALRDGDRFEIGERNLRLLQQAKELGLMVTQWPTMNNTHPWNKRGIPFRVDQPQWLRRVKGRPEMMNINAFRQQFANCLACQRFDDWLEGLIADTMATEFYKSWCMDGDFWGTGAYFHTIIPVTCQADYHDHLQGDSNYACQKALIRLVSKVRRDHPGIYIIICRPLQDLGVWALRNVDACFTLIESGTGKSNVSAGDEIRTASRIRLHHQFLPHWMDQSLLFPSYADMTLENVPPWPSEKIDYIMLSAMSSSPNLLMYLPTQTGIPEKDKLEIKTWLDWGRKHKRSLRVRKDLPDWPEKGKVDGSAHIIENRGLVFLFNPDESELDGTFDLTAESIGLTVSGTYTIMQVYPPSDDRQTISYGKTVHWNVPGQTAVVLEIGPNP